MAPPLQRLADPEPGGSRYLGTAFNASATWQLSGNMECSLGYTHHRAGAALTDIGGTDVNYLQASFRLGF